MAQLLSRPVTCLGPTSAKFGALWDTFAVIANCVVEPEVTLGPAAFEKSGIGIHECPQCGSFLADADYDDEQYDESYYTLASKDIADLEGRWGFRWRYVLDAIVAEMGPSPRVLDVGAGNGFFVKVARDDFGLDATGVEISASSAEFAREVLGVDLEVCDVAEIDGLFDVVTAFSVVEHVSDPRAMVSQLVDRLTPNGLLVLATPNPDCIQRRVKGKERWGMICPPHHLNIMTEAGIDRLLDDAGLDVVRRETISTSVKLVRKFDTKGNHLRRAIFHGLRMSGLGADQLVFARRRPASR